MSDEVQGVKRNTTSLLKQLFFRYDFSVPFQSGLAEISGDYFLLNLLEPFKRNWLPENRTRNFLRGLQK